MSEKRKPDGQFEDIFQEFFETFGDKKASINRKRPRRETTASVYLTQAESETGVDKAVTYQRLNICERCDLSGAEPGSPEPVICPQCSGAGEIRTKTSTFLGESVSVTACSRCKGKGRLVQKPCQRCEGFGYTVEDIATTLKIPPGEIEVTLWEAGDMLDRNGMRGDVTFMVKITPSGSKPVPMTLGGFIKSLFGRK
jgi:molecular chaperone DnaJ